MRILLSGGGTAGHVLPHIAVVNALRKQCDFPFGKGHASKVLSDKTQTPPTQGGRPTRASTLAQSALRKLKQIMNASSAAKTKNEMAYSSQKISLNSCPGRTELDKRGARSVESVETTVHTEFPTEPLEILYLGSKNGFERDIVREWGWTYVAIPTGKFRRYWDWKNLIDPFKLVAGFFKSLRLIHRFKPDVMFSKGGYVSLPVMAAAWMLRVPIVLHDSDARPSLTTRIAARWVKTLCLGYAEAAKHLPQSVQKKIVVTGVPVREELLKGSVKKGLALTSFDRKKPIVLVMGGSLGAQRINEAVQEALPQLLKEFQLIHLTGKGKSRSRDHEKGYKAFEYVKEELADLYAISDVIVSRAGASSIAEIEALRKPCVVIPLGSHASHGDQIVNAQLFKNRGRCGMIPDDELTGERLMQEIQQLLTLAKAKDPTPKSTQGQVSAAEKIAQALLPSGRDHWDLS